MGQDGTAGVLPSDSRARGRTRKPEPPADRFRLSVGAPVTVAPGAGGRSAARSSRARRGSTRSPSPCRMSGSDEGEERSDAAGVEAWAETEEERERRLEELRLVQRYDRSEIKAQDECWVLIDTEWISHWTQYASGKACRPGVVPNRALLSFDKSPLPNLVKVRDYRAVNPMVYALYSEIYGTDGGPSVARYTVDLYSPPVQGKYKEEFLKGPILEARILAQELRAKYEYPPSEPDSEDGKPICCFCVTRQVVENVIYACITCGKHLTAPPRYQKLSSVDDDGDLEFVGGPSDGGGSIGAGRGAGGVADADADLDAGEDAGADAGGGARRGRGAERGAGAASLGSAARQQFDDLDGFAPIECGPVHPTGLRWPEQDEMRRGP